jgi:hypothetical protein
LFDHNAILEIPPLSDAITLIAIAQGMVPHALDVGNFRGLGTKRSKTTRESPTVQPVTKTPKFNPELDFEALKLAAQNKDPAAQFELAKAFKDGKGVEADMDEAVHWYRLAADAGNPDAQCDLAELFETGTHFDLEPQEAVRWYSQAAENGHTRAQISLGNLLEAGAEGVAADPVAAVRWYKKAAQQGLSMGQLNYGRCLLYGIGIGFNGFDAFKWLNAALQSDPNNRDAQYHLGVCCFYGSQGEPPDHVKACQWYQKAADNKQCYAQHDLACCYENGDGVEKSLDKALRLYKSAADNGSADAKLKAVELADKVESAVGLLSEREKEDWLWESANTGNAEASYRYALLLKNKPDPIWTDVIAWFKYAGEQGQEQAYIDLAKCYEEGIGVEKSLVDAASIYMSAHDRGVDVENDVLRCLTLCFEDQLFPDGAEQWLEKQARRNNPKVMIAFATYWRSDRPGGRDFQESLKWYRKASNLGDRDAQYLLGRFLTMKNLLNRERLSVVRWWENKLEKGMGEAATTADFDVDTERGQDKAYEQRSEALKWLHSSADEGSTEALRFLSAMYNRGILLLPNPETAIQYLRKAAELDDAKAQGLLGAALLEGIGVNKNELEAVTWLKKGAESGDSFAQWNLAMCLVDGVGIEQDRQSARQMLEDSAKGQFEQDRFWTEETFALRFDKVISLFRTLEAHKQREAQYWLGICYEFGIGTDRDRDKSIELYYLSSNQGYEPAQRVFSKVPENLQILIKKRLAK